MECKNSGWRIRQTSVSTPIPLFPHQGDVDRFLNLSLSVFFSRMGKNNSHLSCDCKKIQCIKGLAHSRYLKNGR